MRSSTLKALALGATLGVLGCPEQPLTASADAASPRATVEQVDWELRWSGGTPDRSGALVVESDLGLRWTVVEARVTTYAVTLVPCSDTVARRWVGVPRALAHHPGWDDPSQVEPQLAEELGTDTSLTGASFPSTTYCHAHWLVAQGDVGGQREVEDGVSLRVRAAWTDGVDSGAVDLTTDLTDGVLPPLSVKGTGAHATVVLERDLESVFDGLDPREQSEASLAWGALENLVDGASARVLLSETTARR